MSLDDLLAAMLNVPRLEGARCVKDPELAWLDGLSKRRRPHGVVAGRVLGSQRDEGVG